MEPEQLQKLYIQRFSRSELAARNRIWKIMCTDVFSKYISPDCRVVDIGAGYCEFINNIVAKEKIAIDKNYNIYQETIENIMRANRFIGRGEELLCNYFQYSDNDDHHVLFLASAQTQ